MGNQPVPYEFALLGTVQLGYKMHNGIQEGIVT